jgi:hypothetical protein
MEDILKRVEAMDPEEAIDQLGRAVKALFSVLGEEARIAFLLDLIGESERDKVSSLVHL